MIRNCSDVPKMWLDNARQLYIGMLKGIIDRRLGAVEQLHDFMIRLGV